MASAPPSPALATGPAAATARPPSQLTPQARAVLARRYLRPGPDGRVETPDEMFDRVAAAVAGVEARFGATPAEVAAIAARFAARMRALEFLPNSPTLMNAGRPLGQLAACFVVPVEDTSHDIFAALGWAAEIQKSGGGTGFAFSRLRPAGDPVESTGGVASGPVSFMHVFDAATEAIKQGGTRRGANMGILRVDHPDILEFISIKLDPARMRNFNLSVAVTDRFMAAAAGGLRYPLVNPRTGEVVRELDARAVLDLIATAAWTSGDPGMVFIDRVEATNPTPRLGAIEATNPCGEQPLLPFEACTLGSIDLGRFVAAGGDGATGGATIDWDALRACVHDAVRFLDDVVEVNQYPLPAIAAATRATRKIGLGVMGLADLLVELGVPYDHPRALELGEELAAFVERESVAASVALATERGPFPAFAGSRWAERGHPPLRNATTTTVAPTGTISIIAGCSSGIEPLYAVAYERHVLDGEVLAELHPGFVRRAQAAGILDDELVATLRARGRVRGLPAREPRPRCRRRVRHRPRRPLEQHVRMRAASQRHVHAAVSKTINLPDDATPADVRAALRGWPTRAAARASPSARDGSRDRPVSPRLRSSPPRRRRRRRGARLRRRACATAGAAVCVVCAWSACG
ncbi:MAG: adenosylcobalamin-dependent ribonucleoside-diphosphate reductase [Kofleriaceae bacterium]|nr:adenosylcobalamin-dependent ribonucleoside-diphosphate reductase [Kofleriaceae bacterium]